MYLYVFMYMYDVQGKGGRRPIIAEEIEEGVCIYIYKYMYTYTYMYIYMHVYIYIYMMTKVRGVEDPS
jgi:hypothetical protein